MIQLKQVHWRRSSFLLVAAHQFLSLLSVKPLDPFLLKFVLVYTCSTFACILEVVYNL